MSRRNGMTTTVPEYRNINVDEIEGLNYMELMAQIDPDWLLDIDEQSEAPDDFRNRVAHAYRGKPSVRTQIVIGTRTFSVIACLSVYGFICYSIYEGNIGSEEFNQFLRLLQPRLLPNHWNIIDNARIHHTIETRIHMDQIFNGRWTYCARYSPHLKPIELAFSLIKRYLRDNELRAQLNPVALITEAFEIFSVGGARADSVYNMFNLYRRAHYNINH